jgi:hypothetical protein
MSKSWLILAIVLVLTGGCGSDHPTTLADPLDDLAGGSRVVEVPEAEPENDLSFPVVWSDGWALPLRGTFGQAQLGGVYDALDGVHWYRQQDPLNVWQAGAADLSSAPVLLDWVNWGDNLEARSWTVRAKVRAEVVLLHDLESPLPGYEMAHLSGHGSDEMWGTSGRTYDAAQATVYSHCARFTIQKLTADPSVADLIWDVELGQWTGDVLAPVFNHGVWEGAKGHGDGYAAEINIQGKVIYGTLWDVAASGQGVGVYRLTFSLSAGNPGLPLNTWFDEGTRVVPSEEGDAEESASRSGGIARIDPAHNLTYMDVTIVEGTGGGGGGDGGG